MLETFYFRFEMKFVKQSKKSKQDSTKEAA